MLVMILGCGLDLKRSGIGFTDAALYTTAKLLVGD